MSTLLGLLTIVALIAFGIWQWADYHKKMATSHYKQAAREKWHQKILHVLDLKDRLTNADVQRILGVSDATATRYLDQLEKEGVIKQVGMGRHTYYTWA